MELFLRNPRFLGLKFPDMNKPETLEKRYLGKVTKKMIQFMKGLTKMEPSERMSSADSLQNPYFDGYAEKEKDQKRPSERPTTRQSSKERRAKEEAAAQAKAQEQREREAQAQREAHAHREREAAKEHARRSAAEANSPSPEHREQSRHRDGLSMRSPPATPPHSGGDYNQYDHKVSSPKKQSLHKMEPQPEVRAQTQHAATRSRQEDRDSRDDSEALHTSRSISKVSQRPSSPSSLVEWGASSAAVGSSSGKPRAQAGSDYEGGSSMGSKSMEASNSKSRTPRTAGRKKKSQAVAGHHESQQQQQQGGGGAGMGMSYWEEQGPKPASRGGDGSSRQSFRDHRDTQEPWLQGSDSRGGHSSHGRDGGFNSHKNSLYPKYPGDQHDHESSLPQIHSSTGREDFGEQSTDSFLADYLSTLDKHPGARRHQVEEERRPPGSSGGGRHGDLHPPRSSGGRHPSDKPSRAEGSGGAGKQQTAFFRKPSNRTTYDLSSGGGGP